MQQLVQRHRHLARVRDLNSHRVFAGNRCEDVDPLGPRRPRQVRLQLGYPGNPQASGWINLIPGDRRSTRDITRRHLDPERLQCIYDRRLNL